MDVFFLYGLDGLTLEISVNPFLAPWFTLQPVGVAQ